MFVLSKNSGYKDLLKEANENEVLILNNSLVIGEDVFKALWPSL